MRLIDADKLNIYDVSPAYGTCVMGITEEDIELAPTVEAEPVRHAHWIWKGDEGDSRFMCSECRCMENAPTCMGVPDIWEYCPNCGSRMEEYELARKRADTETD